MTVEEPSTTGHTPSHRAGYVRIADDLRMDIEAGKLAPGDPTPSLAELKAQYGVAQQVARAAINLLAEQGLVLTSPGKRTVVRGPRARVTRSNRHHEEEKRRVQLPEEERRRNGPLEDTTGIPIEDTDFRCSYSRVKADANTSEFPEGTELLRREYETRDKVGKRINWSVSWIPVALIEGNPALLDRANEPWPGSVQHQLHTVGIEVAEVHDMIAARAPTTVEADLWGMVKGEPLLTGRDKMIDTSGRIVAVSISQYPGDSTQLEFITRLEPYS